MELLIELRRRLRHAIWPAVGVCAVCYFAYHLVNGDRGLIAWRALQNQVSVARAELAEAREAREGMERRTLLLHPQSIDPDMLDEWARQVLNYGRPEEIVIFTK